MGWHEDRFIENHSKQKCACEVCDRAYFLPPSKAEKYKTCGPECAAARRSHNVLLRQKFCQTCGESFVPRGTQIRIGCGLFCSQKCNIKAREALSSKESQEKAHQGWRARNAVKKIAKSGPEHHAWNGGRRATYERLRDAGKTRIYCMNRQRAKGGDRLPKDISATLGALQRWRCAICEKGIRRKYHVDHITPLSRGGRNIRSNVQLLCPKCNLQKNARDPIEYMQSLGRLL